MNSKITYIFPSTMVVPTNNIELKKKKKKKDCCEKFKKKKGKFCKECPCNWV